MLRRRFIGIGIVVGAGMACLDPSGMPSTVHDAPTGPIVPLGRAVRPSVSAELHVHGWSNHSGSVFPASIAWQTQQAAQAGVDILWWTDHADIYAYRVRDFVVAPTVPTSIGPRTWTVGTWFSGAGSAFIMSSAGSLTGLTTNGSRMVVTLPPGDTSVADTVLLFFGRLIHGTPRRASFGVLARPLIGNPRFEMMVWRDRTTHHFPGLQLTVPLAWHPGGSLGYREVLRYRFQGPVGAPLLNGDTAEYERAWPDSDSTVVVLTPKGDAAIFPDGLDNTTDEY